MTDRRRFITIVPFAGVALLAACSKEVPAPTPAPAPMPAPEPTAPAAAPAAEQPASATASAPATVGAADLPVLNETAPGAVALGYVAVASRADAAKYKTYAVGQACGNCSLYGGAQGSAQGPCPLFAGNQVLATGWCSAYVKKA